MGSGVDVLGGGGRVRTGKVDFHGRPVSSRLARLRRSVGQ